MIVLEIRANSSSKHKEVSLNESTENWVGYVIAELNAIPRAAPLQELVEICPRSHSRRDVVYYLCGNLRLLLETGSQ